VDCVDFTDGRVWRPQATARTSAIINLPLEKKCRWVIRPLVLGIAHEMISIEVDAIRRRCLVQSLKEIADPQLGR
jgi:hypothetical protein